MEGDSTKNTGKNEEKSQEKHSRTSSITHPLDSYPQKIHKGTRTTKGKRIHGRVHPKSHREMRP